VNQVVQKLLTKFNAQEIKLINLNLKMEGIKSENTLYLSLLHKLGIPAKNGTPTQTLHDKFISSLKKLSVSRVLFIFDEMDALFNSWGNEFLYMFTRLNTEIKLPQISFIGITSKSNAFYNTDPIISNCSYEKIFFPPYTANQLIGILYNRAELAFINEAISEGVLEKCAGFTISSTCDTRTALYLLKRAGELADQQGCQKITMDHMDKAISIYKSDILLEYVSSLPYHPQIVLLSIFALIDAPSKKFCISQDITSKDIYKTYIKFCNAYGYKPVSYISIVRILNELSDMGIINVNTFNRRAAKHIILSLNEIATNNIKLYLKQRFLP
jgi:cell division control protein 6